MPGFVHHCELVQNSIVCIELKLDEVVLCLENYLVDIQGRVDREEMSRMATTAIGELQKVIGLRGKVLFVQKRKKRMGETYLAIADPPDA